MSLTEPLSNYNSTKQDTRLQIADSESYGSVSSDTNGSSFHSNSAAASRFFSPRFYRLACIIVTIISLILLICVIYLAVRSPHNPSSPSSGIPTLRDLVTIDKLMVHIKALQKIADNNGGNRMIANSGFNATTDYIWQTLQAATNFKLQKQPFSVLAWEIVATPTLNALITNTSSVSYTYLQDFYVYGNSAGVSTDGWPVTVVPNLGCNASDYASAKPLPATNNIVLVQRNNNCTLTTRKNLALAAGAFAYIEYNDASTTLLPLATNFAVGQNIPMLVLTYEVGRSLVLAALDAPLGSPLLLAINVIVNDISSYVNNICADTITGDPTSTIVIGSHSDSVLAGSGIGDNGSGTSSNLVWAVAVSQLLQTQGYTSYPNRLRFCWWAAEEQGLLGSAYHVSIAKNSTIVGERLIDYQLNLNFDMTSTPNPLIGIYDGDNPTPDILPSTIPGNKALTARYRNYFQQQGLPYDPKPFNGRSDYGSFLAAGIPAGGVSAFIDRTKTEEERNRYDAILGTGKGGIAGAAIDPCYHQHCDTIQNINPWVFEAISKGNAAVLEDLAKMSTSALRALMFPNGRTIPEQINTTPLFEEYE